jgi:Putative transposase
VAGTRFVLPPTRGQTCQWRFFSTIAYGMTEGGGRGVLVWRKLTDGEFIRRFLLHVPPDGFRKIRHFGFLANVS